MMLVDEAGGKDDERQRGSRGEQAKTRRQ